MSSNEATVLDITKPTIVNRVEWFDDRFYKIHLGDGTFDYLPSVTTILEVVNKPHLANWRGQVGNEAADKKMNDAARRGSAIHHAAAILSKGGRVDWINSDLEEDSDREKLLATMRYFHGDRFYAMRCTQDVWLQVVRFAQWWNAINPTLLMSEQNLFNLDLRLAGTLDFLINVKEGEYMINGAKKLKLVGGLYIVDLKTGSQVDDNYFLQISAYTKMLPKEVQEKVVGGMIVHTNASTRTGIVGVATHLRSDVQLAEDFKDFTAAHTLWQRKNEVEKPKILELPTSLTLQELAGPRPGTEGEAAEQAERKVA